jgi:hypothetical protein
MLSEGVGSGAAAEFGSRVMVQGLRQVCPVKSDRGRECRNYRADLHATSPCPCIPSIE